MENKVKLFQSLRPQAAILLLALLSISISLFFVTLWMNELDRKTRDEFSASQYFEISSANITELANRLNILVSNESWVCASASNQGSVFYSVAKTKSCDSSFWRRKIKIEKNQLQIELTVTAPFFLKVAVLLFVGLQISISFFSMYLSKIVERERLARDLAISSAAQQISHDLRSPLAALKVIAARAQLPEETSNLLRESVERIQKMAEEVLKIAKFGYLTQPEENSVKILSVTQKLVEQKKSEYAHRPEVSIALSHHDINESSTVRFNTLLLERILSNLINNSMDAIEGTGKIEISVLGKAPNVFVTVRDSGKGIPGDVLKKLGKKQISFGKSKDLNGGLGIGVFSANQELKKFGGSLEIKSKENAGTSVTLTLKSGSQNA